MSMIEIGSQDMEKRLEIIKILSEAARQNAEAISSLSEKLLSFEYHVHVDNCNFEADKVEGPMISVCGTRGASICGSRFESDRHFSERKKENAPQMSNNTVAAEEGQCEENDYDYEVE